MNWLLETLLANAIVATPLAIMAWLVGRSLRRPAVQHALWILVLIKLITPSFLPVNVTVPSSWTGYFGVHQSGAVTPSGPAGLMAQSASPPISHPVPRATPASSPRGTANPQVVASDTKVNGAVTAGQAGRSAVIAKPAQGPQRTSMFMALLAGIWCVGSVVWWCMNALVVVRFGRQLRAAGLRDRQLQRRADELARRFGLTRVPAVRVIDSGVAPMLWGCSKWTKIVLPAGLLERLDAESRDAVLLHELGHFRRGDHWVRLLQLVVTGVYWWHPVVWWANRQIALHEEQCCDALVVSVSQAPRRYAELILDTLDFLAEHRPAILPVASAMSDVPVVERRLRMIMAGGTEGLVPKWVQVGLICLILASPQPLLMAALPSALANDVEHRLNATETTDNSAAYDTSAIDRAFDEAASRPAVTVPATVEVQLPPPTEHPLLETGPGRGPWSVATSRNGRFQLTALSGGRVQLSDGSNGRTQDLTADGITVAVFLNRDQMLVGTKAGAVRIYDAASGAAVSFLGKHRDQVTSVSLTSYGRRAITASRDGTIMVFNLEANDGILNQWNLQQPISMVRASPDGLLLAVACGDWLSGSGRVRLLELASGRPQLELLAGTAISTLSFRQDSKMLLTADWEGRVIFWDVATGEQCGYGRIAKDEISADSFCPDNDVLASVVMLELFEENVSDHSPQALLE